MSIDSPFLREGITRDQALAECETRQRDVIQNFPKIFAVLPSRPFFDHYQVYVEELFRRIEWIIEEVMKTSEHVTEGIRSSILWKIQQQMDAEYSVGITPTNRLVLEAIRDRTCGTAGEISALLETTADTAARRPDFPGGPETLLSKEQVLTLYAKAHALLQRSIPANVSSLQTDLALFCNWLRIIPFAAPAVEAVEDTKRECLMVAKGPDTPAIIHANRTTEQWAALSILFSYSFEWKERMRITDVSQWMSFAQRVQILFADFLSEGKFSTMRKSVKAGIPSQSAFFTLRRGNPCAVLEKLAPMLDAVTSEPPESFAEAHRRLWLATFGLLDDLPLGEGQSTPTEEEWDEYWKTVPEEMMRMAAERKALVPQEEEKAETKEKRMTMAETRALYTEGATEEAESLLSSDVHLQYMSAALEFLQKVDELCDDERNRFPCKEVAKIVHDAMSTMFWTPADDLANPSSIPAKKKIFGVLPPEWKVKRIGDGLMGNNCVQPSVSFVVPRRVENPWAVAALACELLHRELRGVDADSFHVAALRLKTPSSQSPDGLIAATIAFVYGGEETVNTSTRFIQEHRLTTPQNVQRLCIEHPDDVLAFVERVDANISAHLPTSSEEAAERVFGCINLVLGTLPPTFPGHPLMSFNAVMFDLVPRWIERLRQRKGKDKEEADGALPSPPETFLTQQQFYEGWEAFIRTHVPATDANAAHVPEWRQTVIGELPRLPPHIRTKADALPLLQRCTSFIRNQRGGVDGVRLLEQYVLEEMPLPKGRSIPAQALRDLGERHCDHIRWMIMRTLGVTPGQQGMDACNRAMGVLFAYEEQIAAIALPETIETQEQLDAWTRKLHDLAAPLRTQLLDAQDLLGADPLLRTLPLRSFSNLTNVLENSLALTPYPREHDGKPFICRDEVLHLLNPTLFNMEIAYNGTPLSGSGRALLMACIKNFHTLRENAARDGIADLPKARKLIQDTRTQACPHASTTHDLDTCRLFHGLIDICCGRLEEVAKERFGEGVEVPVTKKKDLESEEEQGDEIMTFQETKNFYESAVRQLIVKIEEYLLQHSGDAQITSLRQLLQDAIQQCKWVQIPKTGIVPRRKTRNFHVIVRPAKDGEQDKRELFSRDPVDAWRCNVQPIRVHPLVAATGFADAMLRSQDGIRGFPSGQATQCCHAICEVLAGKDIQATLDSFVEAQHIQTIQELFDAVTKKSDTFLHCLKKIDGLLFDKAPRCFEEILLRTHIVFSNLGPYLAPKLQDSPNVPPLDNDWIAALSKLWRKDLEAEKTTTAKPREHLAEAECQTLYGGALERFHAFIPANLDSCPNDIRPFFEWFRAKRYTETIAPALTPNPDTRRLVHFGHLELPSGKRTIHVIEPFPVSGGWAVLPLLQSYLAEWAEQKGMPLPETMKSAVGIYAAELLSGGTYTPAVEKIMEEKGITDFDRLNAFVRDLPAFFVQTAATALDRVTTDPPQSEQEARSRVQKIMGDIAHCLLSQGISALLGPDETLPDASKTMDRLQNIAAQKMMQMAKEEPTKTAPTLPGPAADKKSTASPAPKGKDEERTTPAMIVKSDPAVLQRLRELTTRDQPELNKEIHGGMKRSAIETGLRTVFRDIKTDGEKIFTKVPGLFHPLLDKNQQGLMNICVVQCPTMLRSTLDLLPLEEACINCFDPEQKDPPAEEPVREIEKFILKRLFDFLAEQRKELNVPARLSSETNTIAKTEAVDAIGELRTTLFDDIQRLPQTTNVNVARMKAYDMVAHIRSLIVRECPEPLRSKADLLPLRRLIEQKATRLVPHLVKSTPQVNELRDVLLKHLQTVLDSLEARLPDAAPASATDPVVLTVAPDAREVSYEATETALLQANRRITAILQARFGHDRGEHEEKFANVIRDVVRCLVPNEGLRSAGDFVGLRSWCFGHLQAIGAIMVSGRDVARGVYREAFTQVLQALYGQVTGAPCTDPLLDSLPSFPKRDDDPPIKPAHIVHILKNGKRADNKVWKGILALKEEIIAIAAPRRKERKGAEAGTHTPRQIMERFFRELQQAYESFITDHCKGELTPLHITALAAHLTELINSVRRCFNEAHTAPADRDRIWALLVEWMGMVYSVKFTPRNYPLVRVGGDAEVTPTEKQIDTTEAFWRTHMERIARFHVDRFVDAAADTAPDEHALAQLETAAPTLYAALTQTLQGAVARACAAAAPHPPVLDTLCDEAFNAIAETAFTVPEPLEAAFRRMLSDDLLPVFTESDDTGTIDGKPSHTKRLIAQLQPGSAALFTGKEEAEEPSDTFKKTIDRRRLARSQTPHLKNKPPTTKPSQKGAVPDRKEETLHVHGLVTKALLRVAKQEVAGIDQGSLDLVHQALVRELRAAEAEGPLSLKTIRSSVSQAMLVLSTDHPDMIVVADAVDAFVQEAETIDDVLSAAPSDVKPKTKNGKKQNGGEKVEPRQKTFEVQGAARELLARCAEAKGETLDYLILQVQKLVTKMMKLRKTPDDLQATVILQLLTMMADSHATIDKAISQPNDDHA